MEECVRNKLIKCFVLFLFFIIYLTKLLKTDCLLHALLNLVKTGSTGKQKMNKVR